MTAHIIIPALDAASTLPRVVARLPPGGWRLVVVDDGSRDETRRVAEAIARDHPNPFTVLSHPRRRGYGAAQKTGFAHALGEGATMVALLHADGQYPPESIPDLMAPLQSGQVDVSAGYLPLEEARAQGMPRHKRWGSHILTGLLNRAAGARLHCYHSGFRAYTRRAIESIPYMNLSDYYEFDTEMLLAALARGLPIHEFPVPVAYFPGSSRLNPILYGGRVLRAILKFKAGGYHP